MASPQGHSVARKHKSNRKIDPIRGGGWNETPEVIFWPDSTFFQNGLLTTKFLNDLSCAKQLNGADYRVYANPRKDFEQFFKEEKILGIMGNSLFLDKEIVIDYRNKKFGIVNNKEVN